MRGPQTLIFFPYTTLFRSTPQVGGRITERQFQDGADLTKGQLLFVIDRKSTRLNSSHTVISYAVFCFKKNRGSTPARRTPRAVATLLACASLLAGNIAAHK